MKHNPHRGAAPLPNEIQVQARALFEKVGLQLAAEQLGVSAGALARGLAGAPCRAGTKALMTLALQSSAVQQGESR